MSVDVDVLISFFLFLFSVHNYVAACAVLLLFFSLLHCFLLPRKKKLVHVSVEVMQTLRKRVRWRNYAVMWRRWAV
jgi:hypothetical protein